jgi:hypothetical protein
VTGARCGTGRSRHDGTTERPAPTSQQAVRRLPSAAPSGRSVTRPPGVGPPQSSRGCRGFVTRALCYYADSRHPAAVTGVLEALMSGTGGVEAAVRARADAVSGQRRNRGLGVVKKPTRSKMSDRLEAWWMLLLL